MAANEELVEHIAHSIDRWQNANKALTYTEMLEALEALRFRLTERMITNAGLRRDTPGWDRKRPA